MRTFLPALLRSRNAARVALATLILIVQGCISSSAPPRTDPEIITGLASWYGQEFSGRATANGEIFDPMLLTAAHRELPFGTLVEVRNTRNNRAVQVRINDRGPFVGNRIIDLSWAAAEQIGMVEAGVVPVEVVIVAQATPPGSTARQTTTPMDAPPPAIPFPLPDSSTVDADADVIVSDIEVIEVRRGEEVRKRVGADGISIEGGSAPSTGSTRSPGRVAQPSRFVVQLGSFLNRVNAETLHAKVSALLRPAYVEQSGELYRVRVGPFHTREAAIEARERLESSGFSGVLMTADDS
jgi:rare lipoprotein A